MGPGLKILQLKLGKNQVHIKVERKKNRGKRRYSIIGGKMKKDFKKRPQKKRTTKRNGPQGHIDRMGRGKKREVVQKTGKKQNAEETKSNIDRQVDHSQRRRPNGFP